MAGNFTDYDAMSGFGMGLQVLGTGLQIYGQQEATKYQVKELELSEEQARERARQVAKARDWRIRMISRAGELLGGQIEAETGKSGLAMTGSPLEHKVRQARQIELSATMAATQGGWEAQSWIDQARAYSRAAWQTEKAGSLQTFTTIIGALGNMMGGIGA